MRLAEHGKAARISKGRGEQGAAGAAGRGVEAGAEAQTFIQSCCRGGGTAGWRKER